MCVMEIPKIAEKARPGLSKRVTSLSAGAVRLFKWVFLPHCQFADQGRLNASAGGHTLKQRILMVYQERLDPFILRCRG